MSATTVTATPAIVPAGTWNIDSSHSTIGFSVKHMMIATVRGRFTQFAGSLSADEQGHARIDGVVQAASIDTSEAQRDEHLRSADFFDAANHPEIRFASAALTPTAADEYRITGDLTIKGTTRQVTLDATVNGAGTDPWGNERIALEASGTISRKDFGLNWNQVLEAGGVLVGDKIKITLDLSTVKATEQ
jgi:polyisoprenoid-binding protein YceI